MLKKVVSGIVSTLLLIGMLMLAFNIQLVKASGTPSPEHDLAISVEVPVSIPLGASILMNITISNQGSIDETKPNFKYIVTSMPPAVRHLESSGGNAGPNFETVLQAGHNWTYLSVKVTPFFEGIYNVTVYVYPVPGETSIENNKMTKFVTVGVPPVVTPVTHAEVGVKAGDWIKYAYTVTGWPAGTPYPEWLKVEFLGVEGTWLRCGLTMRMSDGTEQNATVSMDVAAGGQALGLSGFAIPANSTVGDSINFGGFGFTFTTTIEGETTRTYAGATRTVVYASISQYGTQLTYHWDKQTGVLVEASMTSGGITGTAKVTETNMWEASPPPPFWTLWWLWTIVAVVIVALAGAVYFLKKRKPPTPTAPTLPTEGT